MSLKTAEKTLAMEELARKLNENLPTSEQWFHDIYRPHFESFHHIELYRDKFNYNFNDVYIPDLINIGYKYIVEIDGSFHDNGIVKIKDERKNEHFFKRDYEVIRINYGDLDSLLKGLSKILEIRKDPKHPISKPKKVIKDKETSKFIICFDKVYEKPKQKKKKKVSNINWDSLWD